MSEKRFTSNERWIAEGTIVDICDNGKVIMQVFDDDNIQNVVDLLNEQQVKIEKQDEEIKKLKRTERSWRRIHCCNKESNNCGIVIGQEATIKQLQGKVKRLNAFIVSKDLAIEYLKWNKESEQFEENIYTPSKKPMRFIGGKP